MFNFLAKNWHFTLFCKQKEIFFRVKFKKFNKTVFIECTKNFLLMSFINEFPLRHLNKYLVPSAKLTL